ncbi:hypothetical protein [Neobacillus cucumis]|uniref:Uncharacterized protein n=1 Tax=Neobacillus cucumis TaxID=1740721 RepID=A0A2N5HSA4_9BACI|nr:hypothetical protein [Neobacillus cucumis]PLS08415.1 hypothetical protein CVD27_03130 [Neobacillus cucumis]
MSKQRKYSLEQIKSQGSDGFFEILTKRISLSDLNSLLLDIFRIRTTASTPSNLLKKYSENRFVQPAGISPIELKHLELELLQLAESLCFTPILLSPVAQLGSCSIIAPVNQNKVISALRGTEVVADSTNSLALYICDHLKKGEFNNKNDFVRFCNSQRIVRAQSFSKAGLLPHFHIFSLVTSGIDKGSYSFEKKALTEHFEMYHRIFRTIMNPKITFRFIQTEGYKDGNGLINRITEYIQEIAPHINLDNNIEVVENSYYQGLQFKVIIEENGEEIFIGDGGFVNWSQKLLGIKKERMLISAIGLDRLLVLKNKH